MDLLNTLFKSLWPTDLEFCISPNSFRQGLVLVLVQLPEGVRRWWLHEGTRLRKTLTDVHKGVGIQTQVETPMNMVLPGKGSSVATGSKKDHMVKTWDWLSIFVYKSLWMSPFRKRRIFLDKEIHTYYILVLWGRYTHTVNNLTHSNTQILRVVSLEVTWGWLRVTNLLPHSLTLMQPHTHSSHCHSDLQWTYPNHQLVWHNHRKQK